MTRRTAILALDENSPFRVDALEVARDLGYEVVRATDELDARSLCETLAPALVLTEPSTNYPAESIRRMSRGATLLVVLESGTAASARSVEGWIHLAAPPSEPGVLARNLHLLTLARQLELPIHVGKQQLTGRIERKSLIDLAQGLASASFTGRVEVKEGSFFMSAGAVIDARCRPVAAEKAFFRLMRTASGPFTVQPGPVVVDRRIRTPTSELIAEAIGEILIQHPPRELRILVNPKRREADLSPVQLQVLETAGRNSILQFVLDGVPAPDGILLQEIVQLQQNEQILVDNPSTSVRIVTDSAVDLPEAALESTLLEVIPLPFHFPGGRETAPVDPTTFYRRLRDGRDIPEPTLPTVEGLRRAFLDLLPKQDLVSIHVSERLSPTRGVAFRAAQQLLQSPAMASYERSAPRLKVIDSQSAGLGTGLLVLFALRMAARGKTADFIAQKLSRFRNRMISLYGIGDASYFARHSGDRIGSSWRRSGSTPILSMAGGVLETVATVDTPHDIERRMTDVLRTSLEPGSRILLAIGHAAARQSARLLRQIIERDFEVLETVEGEIGPLLGRRTGPGAISASIFVPEPEEVPWIQPVRDLQSDFQ